MNKVVSLQRILPLRAAWRATGKTLVFTNGVFDLLHFGHVHYLQEARALGDVLIVGLNSDASTRRLKGPTRPLVPQTERAGLLAALSCVDYVVIFAEDTAENLASALQPEIYVKGGDYRLGTGDATDIAPHKPLPEARIVTAYGGKVVLLPYLPGHSTSELLEKIRRMNE